jgi:hypothetical protein
MSIRHHLVTHLMAADVRRHRLLLAAWIAIVIISAAVDGGRPIVTAERFGPSAAMLASLLSLTESLLLLVLVPAVVQTHPLVGSDAFWMTRPIPPRTLLVAKIALLVIVTVVVPTAVETVLMAFYAVPPAQIAGIAVQTALYNALWMILLATAASLTPNLTRFALLAGGVLAALALILATTLAIAMARLDDLPPFSDGSDTNDPTAGFVMTVLGIVAGLDLLLVQYTTRSRVRSVAAGAAALTLAYAIAAAWPWRMLAPILELPAWATVEGALRLSANPATVEVKEEESAFSQRASWRLARARVWLAGVEPNWTADVTLREATLHVGGTRLESVGAGYPAAVPVEGNEERPTRVVLRQLLTVERLNTQTPPRGESPIVFSLRDSEFNRVAPAIGAYEGRFEVRLTRYDLEATLPLQRGARYSRGAYHFVIQGVERRSGSVSILGRESDAVSIFDRRPNSERTFYLRNARTRHAVAGSANIPDHAIGPLMFLPFAFGYSENRTSGFEARNLLIRFAPESILPSESFSIDEAWLQGAELVLVQATREGSVERPLQIANFPLGKF